MLPYSCLSTPYVCLNLKKLRRTLYSSNIYFLAIFSVYCDIILVANQIILSIMDIDRMFTFCNKIIGCTKPFLTQIPSLIKKHYCTFCQDHFKLIPELLYYVCWVCLLDIEPSQQVIQYLTGLIAQENRLSGKALSIRFSSTNTISFSLNKIKGFGNNQIES